MHQASLSSELNKLVHAKFQLVMNQVLKDFNLIGLQLVLPDPCSPQDFLNIFFSEIYELSQNNPQSLRSLLYRMDLNENILVQALELKEKERLPFLCEKILLRILERLNWRSKEF